MSTRTGRSQKEGADRYDSPYEVFQEFQGEVRKGWSQQQKVLVY
jgi:hypothetical protein